MQHQISAPARTASRPVLSCTAPSALSTPSLISNFAFKTGPRLLYHLPSAPQTQNENRNATDFLTRETSSSFHPYRITSPDSLSLALSEVCLRRPAPPQHHILLHHVSPAVVIGDATPRCPRSGRPITAASSPRVKVPIAPKPRPKVAVSAVSRGRPPGRAASAPPRAGSLLYYLGSHEVSTAHSPQHREGVRDLSIHAPVPSSRDFQSSVSETSR